MTLRDIALINTEYIASAVRPDQYPDGDRPEIAFLGRSNVGKSSLINSLCNRKGLAKVSGAPGKTRTINFFAGDVRERTASLSADPFFSSICRDTALPGRAVKTVLYGAVL